MLTRVALANFRSFGPEATSIPLAPITVLLGRNGSGKSSFLKALLAMKQTVQSPYAGRAFVANGPYTELGSYGDYVHGHGTSNKVLIRVEWSPVSTQPSEEYHLLEASLALRGTNRSRVVVSSYHGVFDRVVVSGIRERLGSYRLSVKSQRGTQEFAIPRHKADTKFYGLGRVLLQFPEIDRAVYMRISRAIRSFESLFEQLVYIGPLREYPRRLYYFPEAVYEQGVRGEHAVGLLSLGERTDMLLEKLREWLTHFGLSDGCILRRVGTAQYYQLLLQDPFLGTRVNFADAAFGASQVLPIIVQGFGLQPYGTLILEQPEIHLHPAAQARLGDLLIDIVKAGPSRLLIVETHSDHLVMRLQRRIAEGVISPHSVRVLFLEPGPQGSSVRELGVAEDGHITNWPEGLFESALEDSLALAKASQQRREA